MNCVNTENKEPWRTPGAKMPHVPLLSDIFRNEWIREDLIHGR